jgi:uncharacterized protein YlxP (DUF503 family)
MYIGIYKVTIHLPENHDLKNKRKVIQSIITKLRNHFNAAVAEVDNNDQWQLASIGFCCISNEAIHARQLLDSMIKFFESNMQGFQLVEEQKEVVAFPID